MVCFLTDLGANVVPTDQSLYVSIYFCQRSQVVAQLSLGSYFANAIEAFSYPIARSLYIRDEKQKAQVPELAHWSVFFFFKIDQFQVLNV